MKQKINKCENSCRLGKVGGQAVLEGVMMKAGNHTVTTCRKEDGSLVVYDADFVSVREKNKILNLPIIRGVVNFIEMMRLSLKTMSASADALGIEEEDGKIEKWLKKHIGARVTDVIMVLSLILGLALSVFLFMFLPTAIADLLDYLLGGKLGVYRAIVEGVAKIGIFIAYLFLVSLMPDIKRTFMYHGAEHKSIACFEAGCDLTPANAKNYTRFHPRCGTSFMFVMILLGIVVGIVINNLFPGLNRFVITAIRLLILPLVVGLGYEFIMFAGKHDNPITRALSAPGLWMQRITTREPTEDMLEIAIISLKCSLRDDFDEFKEFFELRSWEPKTVESSENEEVVESSDEPVADNQTADLTAIDEGESKE